jgi:hypothetical protein
MSGVDRADVPDPAAPATTSAPAAGTRVADSATTALRRPLVALGDGGAVCDGDTCTFA